MIVFDCFERQNKPTFRPPSSGSFRSPSRTRWRALRFSHADGGLQSNLVLQVHVGVFAADIDLEDVHLAGQPSEHARFDLAEIVDYESFASFGNEAAAQCRSYGVQGTSPRAPHPIRIRSGSKACRMKVVTSLTLARGKFCG